MAIVSEQVRIPVTLAPELGSAVLQLATPDADATVTRLPIRSRCGAVAAVLHQDENDRVLALELLDIARQLPQLTRAPDQQRPDADAEPKAGDLVHLHTSEGSGLLLTVEVRVDPEADAGVINTARVEAGSVADDLEIIDRDEELAGVLSLDRKGRVLFLELLRISRKLPQIWRDDDTCAESVR